MDDIYRSFFILSTNRENTGPTGWNRKGFCDESKNGIYLEGQQTRRYQEKLENIQSEERRNVVVAYKSKSLLALNLALPVHFIDKSNDLDNLMRNFNTSHDVRIILIHQGKDTFESLNIDTWHNTLSNITSWKKVVDTNQIGIRYLDARKTFSH